MHISKYEQYTEFCQAQKKLNELKNSISAIQFQVSGKYTNVIKLNEVKYELNTVIDTFKDKIEKMKEML